MNISVYAVQTHQCSNIVTDANYQRTQGSFKCDVFLVLFSPLYTSTIMLLTQYYCTGIYLGLNWSTNKMYITMTWWNHDSIWYSKYENTWNQFRDIIRLHTYNQTWIQNLHIQDQDKDEDSRVSRLRPRPICICQRQFTNAKLKTLSEEKIGES